MQQVLLGFLYGYLWGSLLWSVMVCRCKGKDIFQLGSGNAGATNVRRILGPVWAKVIFALDFFKGVVAAGVPLLLMGREAGLGLALATFLGAILGHSFSIFHRFKGGKAVATTMGGLCVLAPWVLCGGVLVWLAVFYSLRYVSVASMAFGISLPLLSILTRQPFIFKNFCFALMFLILLLHRKNLINLWHGREKKL